MNLCNRQGYQPLGRASTAASVAAVGLALAAPAAFSAESGLAPLVDAQREEAVALAMDLFDYAELGYLETRRTKRLASYL